MAEQPSGNSAEAISTKVRSGMRAVTVAQVSSQILTICALAILLRYISKEAFGIFGMALPLLTLRVHSGLPRHQAADAASGSSRQPEVKQDHAAPNPSRPTRATTGRAAAPHLENLAMAS